MTGTNRNKDGTQYTQKERLDPSHSPKVVEKSSQVESYSRPFVKIKYRNVAEFIQTYFLLLLCRVSCAQELFRLQNPFIWGISIIHTRPWELSMTWPDEEHIFGDLKLLSRRKLFPHLLKPRFFGEFGRVDWEFSKPTYPNTECWPLDVLMKYNSAAQVFSRGISAKNQVIRLKKPINWVVAEFAHGCFVIWTPNLWASATMRRPF